MSETFKPKREKPTKNYLQKPAECLFIIFQSYKMGFLH